MARPKVWLDILPPPDALARLEAEVEVCGPRTHLAKPDPFIGIEEADAAIISAFLRWDGPALDRARRLRVLARVGIGTDNVDMEAATRRGIPVVNTPEGPTESTAEHTVALMLALAKRICHGDRMTRARGWRRSPELLGTELAGKTLGLVGLGRIGGRVAQIAQAIGLRVLAYDPYISQDRAQAIGATLVESLEALLRQSDIVSLHVPLTAETQGMMGAAQFAQMKKGAYFINCARGALVDEGALLNALRSGRLAGAALDVMAQEPPPADHPLLGLENVIITPHIGSYTQEGVGKMFAQAIEQTLRALRGERPAHLVNPAAWPPRR